MIVLCIILTVVACGSIIIIKTHGIIEVKEKRKKRKRTV